MTESRDKKVKIALVTTACVIAASTSSGSVGHSSPDQKAGEISAKGSDFETSWQVLKRAVSNGEVPSRWEQAKPSEGEIFAQFRNIAWGNI